MIRRLHVALWLALVLGSACDSAGGSASADATADADTAVPADAAGAEVAADAPPGVDAALLLVDPTTFEPEIERIAGRLAAPDFEGRDEGTPGGAAARAFLIAEWQRCGIEPLEPGGSFEQPVTTGRGTNLVGRVVGTDPALRERHVLVSAHYDHLGVKDGVLYPGAYDNAVAVAIVIGVACHLAADPPARSVLVAHWDAEEPPTVRTDAMGSAFYVANPLVPLAQTDVAIVLDLTGAGLWPGYAGHVALGAETSPEVTAGLVAAPVPDGLSVLRGGLHLAEEQVYGHHAWSDYDAFRDAEVPVLFLSDGQTRVYHTPEDTMDGVDVPKAGREAAFLLGLAGRLADAAATPRWAPRNDYALDAATTLTLLDDAHGPDGLAATLEVRETTRALLVADRQAAEAAAARIAAAGGAASEEDILALRTAVQRLMCVCSPLPAMLCEAL
jgi:hypothetical protein